jgi:hypothetical protein
MKLALKVPVLMHVPRRCDPADERAPARVSSRAIACCTDPSYYSSLRQAYLTSCKCGLLSSRKADANSFTSCGRALLGKFVFVCGPSRGQDAASRTPTNPKVLDVTSLCPLTFGLSSIPTLSSNRTALATYIPGQISNLLSSQPVLELIVAS